MKFAISRTSEYRKEYRPHPRAVWDDKGEEWMIEVNTLEELLSLDDSKWPRLVVGSKSIEIYDDYRE